MNLSLHVSLEEFEASQIAVRYHLINKMNAAQTFSAKQLCVKVLDKIRDHYGKEISISSGFRNPVVNRIAKGSSSSQHTRGEAADFTIKHLSVDQVFNDIRHRLIADLTWDQLIHEEGWVHISYREGRNRLDVLRATFTHDGVTYNKVSD